MSKVLLVSFPFSYILIDSTGTKSSLILLLIVANVNFSALNVWIMNLSYVLDKFIRVDDFFVFHILELFQLDILPKCF